MINFDKSIGISQPSIMPNKTTPAKSGFSDTAKKYMESVNDQQVESNNSIKDMLTGKNQDITSVVTEVAKADVSFKLLVGVRNKLIEAYKQTMNMPL